MQGAQAIEQPTLDTERLILRPFELADAERVQQLAGDFEVADTTLNIPHPYREGMAEAWILTHKPMFRAGVLANYAVTFRSGELIGAVGLRIDPRHNNAELGYWIGRAHWGNGYCTEAARGVLVYAFYVLELNRVHASHLARNPASGRVMQKLGMRHEGCLRRHVCKWEKYEDLEKYGILANEFKK
jgi:[ribosomal protein S5]-alanine N-acetyltransferase